MYQPWFPANFPTQPMPWLRGEPSSCVVSTRWNWGITPWNYPLNQIVRHLNFGWQNQFEDLNRMNLRSGELWQYIYFIYDRISSQQVSWGLQSLSGHAGWLYSGGETQRGENHTPSHPDDFCSDLWGPWKSRYIKVFAEFCHTLMFDGPSKFSVKYWAAKVLGSTSAPSNRCRSPLLWHTSWPRRSMRPRHPDVTWFCLRWFAGRSTSGCVQHGHGRWSELWRRRLAKGQDLG